MALGLGSRVQVTNPRHRWNRRIGVIVGMDRGNVTVRLDDGTEFVTRMTSLGPAPDAQASELSPRDRERLARRAAGGDLDATTKLFVAGARTKPSILVAAMSALDREVVYDAIEDAFPDPTVVLVFYGDDRVPTSAAFVLGKDKTIEYVARLALAIAKDEVADIDSRLDDAPVEQGLEARRSDWQDLVDRLRHHVENGRFRAAADAWGDFDQDYARIHVVDAVDFGDRGIF